MTPSTEKRLFQYAWSRKKSLFIGLIFLMIAVALELAGPFIAKVVIDDHILGVEGTWYEVEESDRATASYNDRLYKREDRLTDEDDVTNDVTLLQIGTSYYIVQGDVPLQGKREVDGGVIHITQQDHSYTVAADQLSLQEMKPFFQPEIRPIFILLGIYMLLLIIAGFFQFAQTFILQKTSNQIVQSMRNDVFAHTQQLPMDYYVHTPAGSVVSRITNDTEAIRDLYERVLSIIVTSIIYMAGIFIALFMLDRKLAIFCLFVIPLIYGWMQLYKHFGSKYNTVIRSTISKINGKINESIQGMPIIQAFRQEKRVSDEFETLNERHFIFQRKLVRLSALTSFNLVTVFRNITFVLFIWYFGSRSLDVSAMISIGVLYAFVDYITRLFEPVTNIVNQLPLIEQARVAGRRIFALMDLETEKMDHSPIRKYTGKVEFDAVSFAYDGKQNVLNNISFTIRPGETVAFVGHTGSGKSTIMNILFRFYDPQQGEVRIDDRSIHALSRQQVRSHMGIVLQDPFLFSGTILSNITMNDPRITKEKAIEALHAVGADQFISMLPKKYDEPVSEGGSTFSLGERQLLSFARALAFDPAILILDEATANIDTETEHAIQRALEIVKQNRTTLVIAHRLSTIQQADQIFVLDHGTIKERGTHENLLQQRGYYHAMYQMQQGKLALEKQMNR